MKAADGARAPLRGLAGDAGGFPGREALGASALIDSGLPTIVFVTVFSLAGRELEPAAWAAVATGVVLAVVRLLRRESVQNVLAGFVAVAIAAWFSARTGRAADFFLPGLFINGGYALAYVVSIAVRWPLLGVLVSAATGQGMEWRREPELARAYSLASWFWVAMFSLRLAVQLPLYLAGDAAVVALGVARVAMGWPLFFIALYASWLVIRPARRAVAARREDQATDPSQAPA